MTRIHFVRENLTLDVKEGITILEAMRLAGMEPDAPCGGQGKCGKCLVYLPESGRQVLACQEKVEGETLTVATSEEEAKTNILTEALSSDVEYDPVIKSVRVTVPPCPVGKSISDWTRFLGALEEKLSGCRSIHPDPEIIAKLTSILKKNKGEVFALCSAERIYAISDQPFAYYMAAFDIGTTTVAGYLLHGENGEVVCTSSRLNPQRKFGADVISRADYALTHGCKELTDCVQTAIREMIAEMAEKASCTPEDVYLVSIAGNTCMHHLFLGLDVDSLVHAPYNPAVRETMMVPADYCHLAVNPRAQVVMLPNIAGFVGADTTACLVATDLALEKDWTLLIDIGTNGEMVLGKDHKLAACSTAAGPAFEGVGISMGMRGSEGAISHAVYEDGAWKLSVIGGGKAKGICGSGLMDIAAELLRSEQMDEGGQLEEDEVILVPAEESAADGPVKLTRKDIRELQMAKAAIRAGIELLAEHMNIKVTDIRQVWLAGAFGSFMDHRSACRIGMIPQTLVDRIVPVGNAAGLGAQKVLKNRSCLENAGILTENVDFLELAVLPEFQDRFVDALMFE